MGLFSGGLTFGSFFVYKIVGLIFGWANFRVGLLSGVYSSVFLYRGKLCLVFFQKMPHIMLINMLMRRYSAGNQNEYESQKQHLY